MEHLKIRVLGCSGAIAAGQRTTAFLVGDDVLVDAGTGVGELSLDALLRIDHVLLTHSHLDHIAALPLMADSVMRLRHAAARPPISVHALPQTLEALQTHILNGIIWPDFCRLPTPQRPVMVFKPLQLGERRKLPHCVVQSLPASHTVPAVGYAVWPGDSAEQACWAFTGDTGPHPALWDALAQLRVAHLVIEAAFSDAEEALAQRSQHMNPSALAQALQRFASDAEIYITHTKPADAAAIAADVARLGLSHRVHFLQAGQCMTLGEPVETDVFCH